MYLNEEIIIRVGGDGRSYVWWTRPVGTTVNSYAIPDQATANATATGSTMTTAILAALPTLES